MECVRAAPLKSVEIDWINMGQLRPATCLKSNHCTEVERTCGRLGNQMAAMGKKNVLQSCLDLRKAAVF